MVIWGPRPLDPRAKKNDRLNKRPSPPLFPTQVRHTTTGCEGSLDTQKLDANKRNSVLEQRFTHALNWYAYLDSLPGNDFVGIQRRLPASYFRFSTSARSSRFTSALADFCVRFSSNQPRRANYVHTSGAQTLHPRVK